jgi:hypothetical protein
MRLINTKTLQLKHFESEAIRPQYAILSHCWGQEEISLQEMVAGPDKAKNGYKKIEGACKQASNDGHLWIWIDTCCIDKTSSAELSEAINSMYQWYQLASICYAYLEDVTKVNLNALNPNEVRKKRFLSAYMADLSPSRWFRRGWTLQELLAPNTVEFYDKTWAMIGCKNSRMEIRFPGLIEALCQLTRIHEPVLNGLNSISSYSIAQRMSWASTRTTTRPEDMAYCLLGVFNVNMPLLYGEGAVKAFLRLQEEVMKESDDQSIFAWEDPSAHPCCLHGFLADSTKGFINSGNITECKMPRQSVPYGKTNMGLRITLPISNMFNAIAEDELRPTERVRDAILKCGMDTKQYIAVTMVLLSYESNQYARIYVNRLKSVRKDLLPGYDDTTLYIRNRPRQKLQRPYVLSLERGYKITAAWPMASWTKWEDSLTVPDDDIYGLIGAFLLQCPGEQSFVVGIMNVALGSSSRNLLINICPDLTPRTFEAFIRSHLLSNESKDMPVTVSRGATSSFPELYVTGRIVKPWGSWPSIVIGTGLSHTEAINNVSNFCEVDGGST